MSNQKISNTAPTFVDAFAGCGGLSLGLMKSGWNGLFAVEKNPFAFDTLQANLLSDKGCCKFQWPHWLPKEPLDIEEAVTKYSDCLTQMRGSVTLLAGGPPCQGFSSAGRRNPMDTRNNLVHSYITLVQLLEPDMVLLENVRGITYDFTAEEVENYAQHIDSMLEDEYYVYTKLLRSSSYGVPQRRQRFFLIAFRKDAARAWPHNNPFALIDASKRGFLQERGLPARVGSRAAISDLEVARNGTIECPDTKGYQATAYIAPKTAYQRLMREESEGLPSDTRLAKHRPHIVRRFRAIIKKCIATGRLNTSIAPELKRRYQLRKQAIRVMDPTKPAPTITSMPDDLLHYSEPRTLTVRENARLQSFPDWFSFKGKYTTGGHLRRHEVPRFTQVANAVPPLLAELIGKCLIHYLPQRQKRPRAIAT